MRWRKILPHLFFHEQTSRPPPLLNARHALYMTMLGTNSTGLFLARILSATLRPTRVQGRPPAAAAFAESIVFTILLLFRADKAFAGEPTTTPARRYSVLEQVRHAEYSTGSQGGGAAHAAASRTPVRSAGHLYS
jgi:hypothetical protein